MRVVGSGADGPLGVLLSRALASDHAVTGIGQQVEAGGDLGESRYRQADLRVPDAVRESLVEAEVIVHAQPHAQPPAAEEDPDGIEWLDLVARGTYVLTTAACDVGIGRIVLISQLKLMEDYAEDLAVRSFWLPLPKADVPGLAPYTAELVCREISRTGRIEVTCLRFGELDAAEGTSSDDAVKEVADAIQRKSPDRGHSWTLHHVATAGRFAGGRG